MKATTLTKQELDASYLADFDLGPGYPQYTVSQSILSLYSNADVLSKSLAFFPEWNRAHQSELDARLTNSVKRFLRVSPASPLSIRWTFSGSIALDRALSAIQRIARDRGTSNITAVTTTPCIDIMKLFLEERSEIDVMFVPSNKGNVFGKFDPDLIIETLDSARLSGIDSHIVLILTSPENPTGATWDSESLIKIAQACKERGVTLLMDHCFALAGIHDSTDIVRIWDLPCDSCEWIAIWDTGKTFGLNEDKLGFILASSDYMTRFIDDSVAVLQFGVARRVKLFYAELFDHAAIVDYTEEFGRRCLQNYEYLCNISCRGFSVVPIDAGSLVLLNISGSGFKDEEARGRLLEAGIGVIAGSVFFHTLWKPCDYIRLALARDHQYFTEAVNVLSRVLG